MGFNLGNWLKVIEQELYILLSSYQNPPAPVPPVIVTPTPANPTPTQPVFDQVGALTKLIIARSTPYTSWWPSDLDRKLINSFIGPVSTAAAQDAAARLVAASQLHKLDLGFLVAQTFQEAHWSANTYNHNLFEHNGVITFNGTDWGIAQNSGTVLKSFAEFADKTEAEITATVLTVAWAIPFYGQVVAGLYEWASAIILTYRAEIKALPEFASQTDLSDTEALYWLIAGAYNAGRNGILGVIGAGGYRVVKNDNGTTTNVPYTYGHSVTAFARQFRPLITAPI